MCPFMLDLYIVLPGTRRTRNHHQVTGTSQKLLKTTIVPRFWTKIRKMFSRPHLKPFEQRWAEADGGSIATATGTGASPPLIVSTYSVSGSCFVAGNAWCIANSFVPRHHCFCLRHSILSGLLKLLSVVFHHEEVCCGSLVAHLMRCW